MKWIKRDEHTWKSDTYMIMRDIGFYTAFRKHPNGWDWQLSFNSLKAAKDACREHSKQHGSTFV